MFLFPPEYVLGRNPFLAVSTGEEFGLLMLACRDRKKNPTKQNIRLRLKKEEFRFPLSVVTFVTWAKARLKHVSPVGKLINRCLSTPTL